ncbi:MAG: potassium channel protein [Salinivirgaceae bacterium]|nr:MAG: potassium channel protein [Salinivirgaceae bacterium]
MKQNFDLTENHIIVCGYGRVGRQASSDLLNHYERFVILERDEKVIDKIIENQQLKYINGDATEDEVLEKANVRKARALIATFPNDADNLFVIITARALNPTMKIVSRVAKEVNMDKLIEAGANEVIMPDKVGGTHMAQLVTRPDLIEFLDTLLLQSTDDVNLDEIQCIAVPDGEKTTIASLSLRQKTGVNVVGIKKINGELIHNPRPDIKIAKKDILLVLGTPEQIQSMRELIQNCDD